LTRNTLWNLLGQGVPLLVALFTIPLVIRGFGVERFGVLTLVWALLGYFTLFDLGLGRAVTWLVARQTPESRLDDPGALLGTAIAASAGLGVLGAAILLVAGHAYFASQALSVDAGLRAEIETALWIVAALLPVVTSASVLHGVLEGYQRFDAVNLIRIPSGVLGYLVPLAVLQFTDTLPAVVTGVAAVRVATAVASLLVCRRAAPHRPLIGFPRRLWLGRLLAFGGWVSVSNVVGPLMIYLDRFVIGAVVSLAAVAYYTTPFEVVTRLWIVPMALGSTLFPAFAATNRRDVVESTALFTRANRLMFTGMVPLVFVTVAFAPEGLKLWVGEAFSERSTTVARVLAAGVLVNSMAFVPLALIHGAGRTDLSAKLHICELPFYVAALWLLTSQFGIAGAAIAWTVRAGADCLLMFWLARRFLRDGREAANGAALAVVGAGLAAAAALADGLVEKTVAVLIVLLASGAYAWFRLRRE
jgi:O-antigen/teichoic acid export membrane protein